MQDALYGGIEAGGTKFVCGVGDGAGRLVDLTTFPTTTPDETLRRTLDYFRPHRESSALQSLGIGSFGPIDPDPSSATFGYVTTTPKAGWQQTNFARYLGDRLGVPVAFDTDTNAAAVGEHHWGAAQDLDTFIYLTVGTGVGGGGLVRGRRMRGLVHPEMGHLMLPRAEHDDFNGACPFHGDCLEGMVSGPALHTRAGGPPERVPADDEMWTFVVHYLAAAIVNYICVLSPQRIVIGGGVMRQGHLFPRIRKRVLERLNGYVQSDVLLTGIDGYIVPPALGERSGVLGATALAQEAADTARIRQT